MNCHESNHSVRILIIDDHLAARRLYASYLRDDYDITIAENGEEAIGHVKKRPFDLYITDLVMPGMDGITLIKKIRQIDPDAAVIVCTQTEEIDLAVAAFRQNPLEFLRKPIRKNLLVNAVERIIENGKLRQKITDLATLTGRDPGCPDPVLGESPVMREFWDRIRRTAASGMVSAVLITGESGTGKEVVARQIHRWSRRSAAPFVAVNCGLLTPELAASELMGVTRGVATGVEPRKGKFAVADGGVLFLDEVTELPPAVQPMLLRVLQERCVSPLGSNHESPVDVMILAATNKDPARSVSGGQFREDLFYRLATVTVRIPPLRNRKEDIPELLLHLYRRHGGTGPLPLDRSELAEWMNHSWPGNIRQLENALINRIITGHPIELTGPDFFRPDSAPDRIDLNSGMTWEEIRDKVFRYAIERAGGNIREAARRLNIPKSTLWEHCRKTPESIATDPGD